MKVICEREIWSDSVVVAVFDSTTGRRAIAKPLEFEIIQEGMPINNPTLRLKASEAQFLIDQLWGCGLRPTEGSGSAGSLAATERHLKDMQTIAMAALRAKEIAV